MGWMLAVPLVAAAARGVLDSLLGGGTGAGITAIVGGVIGNQADRLIEDATGASWNFFKNLRTQDPALNHDLERGTREAYLLATLELIRQAELRTEVGTAGSRLMSAGHADALATIRKGIQADLKNIDDTLPARLADAHLFLLDEKAAPADGLHRLRETLRKNLAHDLARWLPERDVPPVVNELLESGWVLSTSAHRNVPRDWYSLVAIAFIEKLKTTPRLSTVFESQLLAQIATRESAAAPIASFAGFTAQLDTITAPLQRVEDTLGIIGRDIQDIKTDVRDIKEAVSFIGRVPRLMWVSSAVLLVAATVIAGAVLLNRNTSTTAPDGGNDWMTAAAKEAGVDLDSLTGDQFTITVKSSVTMGDNNAMLDIRVPSALDAIVSRGALEYRVGSRPWKTSFINPVSGELIAMLDTRDMEAGGPVQLRLDRQPGTLAGPFVGPFEYAIDVRTELQRAGRTHALTSTNWLKTVGATWSIDSQFIEATAAVVRAVRIGTERGRLTLRSELPPRPGAGASPQDLANYGVRINSMLLTEVLRFGIRDRLYGQVELFDGTLGPVVEFKAASRPLSPGPAALGAPSGAITPTFGNPTAQPRAAPNNADITGVWTFQPVGRPSEPGLTLTFTATPKTGAPTQFTLKGAGLEGSGFLAGTSGSFSVSASSGVSTNGNLTFDSSGGLQMHLEPNPFDQGTLPSGRFAGRKR
jgi:hypothetical protein